MHISCIYVNVYTLWPSSFRAFRECFLTHFGLTSVESYALSPPPLDAVSTLEASCLTLERRKKCTPPLLYQWLRDIIYFLNLENTQQIFLRYYKLRSGGSFFLLLNKDPINTLIDQHLRFRVHKMYIKKFKLINIYLLNVCSFILHIKIFFM